MLPRATENGVACRYLPTPAYRIVQWFSTWVATPWGSFAFFLSELLIKLFMITCIFYISCMEPLFVVDKPVASPGKNDSLLFHSHCVKCDYNHCSTVAFGNAQITL